MGTSRRTEICRPLLLWSTSSSMYSNGISISVSDDEPDDLAGKINVRARRKRKKLGFRGKNELVHRFLRQLVKWWPVLLFLPAAGLLLFEASRIGRKTKPLISELVSPMKPDPILEKTEGNLNRLDPTTRVVGGVRERKFFLKIRKEFLSICVTVSIIVLFASKNLSILGN
ncbi:unnamed protein product [Ilex paraguariensis]|uniref:Uncharacterized protein n=1 Tax=Ilex paraguariensis TaxID=185542 RepID=A0ABC8TW26_9AQUA